MARLGEVPLQMLKVAFVLSYDQGKEKTRFHYCSKERIVIDSQQCQKNYSFSILLQVVIC